MTPAPGSLLDIPLISGYPLFLHNHFLCIQSTTDSFPNGLFAAADCLSGMAHYAADVLSGFYLRILKMDILKLSIFNFLEENATLKMAYQGVQSIMQQKWMNE